LFLVNGLSNETLEIFGFSMCFGSWIIQDLSGILELEMLCYY